MPITHATQPSADNPSTATNTTMAPDPDMGGDLVAAIALLAQTLAAQNACPQAAQSAPAVLVTSPTRLREPNTFNGSDANKLRVFILQCSLHFQDHANAFSSGKAKVAYALSFITAPPSAGSSLHSLTLPHLHGSTIGTSSVQNWKQILAHSTWLGKLKLRLKHWSW